MVGVTNRPYPLGAFAPIHSQQSSRKQCLSIEYRNLAKSLPVIPLGVRSGVGISVDRQRRGRRDTTYR